MSSAERKKLTSEDILAARKHRLSLLRSLRAHLVRDAQLAATEREMALQRALMGKGAAKKLENAKRVEVENDEEGDDDEEADERGGTKGEWRARRFKWKAERRR
jgi:U3 small nucleolar RNA-associated protein 11